MPNAILLRMIAYVADSVVPSAMRGVICCKMSPHPRAVQFVGTCNLTIIKRYNHGAIVAQ